MAVRSYDLLPVHLNPSSSSGVKAAESKALIKIGELRVFVEDPTEGKNPGELTGDLKTREFAEEWSLETAEHWGLQVGLERGEVLIGNVRGGVHVEIGAGSAHIDVPSGPVHLELGEGAATLRLVLQDVGRISVHSPRNRPRLSVEGRPASWRLLNEAYVFQGPGTSEIEIETFSAEVEVALD